ncbi:MAG: methionine--tRNA ligase [Deltaproteobacteria bacterium]|nr:methionine--tRNA ligase [Deltaproteobacteria bacterium]
MNKHFYITTPIYYVNDVPHIGHSYTTIAADTYARFKRFSGENVFFLTGTDEHGQKIKKTADKMGKTPIQLADSVVIRFKDLWTKLNITNDDFIRTTEKRHIEAVQEIFTKLYEKGDVYKGSYEGWYCVHCESYFTDLDVGKEHLCPDCGRKVEKLTEESYFFKLSKYEKPLLKYYEEHPEFVIPQSRYNEVTSFVRSGLKDLSITRTSLDWGIPVPFDKKHVIYVWFDALFNYVSGIGYAYDKDKFRNIWPPDVHFVGKDILRFHAVYWPAFLMSAELPLPRHIVAHGWWMVKETKMSKSLGNVVNPLEMMEKYGRDAYRYFLLREVPFGLDGNFSEEAFVNRLNSDLANDLSNLVWRFLSMVEKYNQGVVKRVQVEDHYLEQEGRKAIENIKQYMNRFAFNEALEEIWSLIGKANKYITDKEPWVLKKKGEEERLQEVLYNILSSLRLICFLISPLLPDTADKMWTQLGFLGKVTEKTINDVNLNTEEVKVKKKEMLFHKFEEKIEKEEEINIDELKKVKLKVAKIISCEEIKGSRKLWKLKIDVGEENLRTLAAGLKDHYSPEELIGKNIIIVSNLKPAKLMGVTSQGMLLAAEDKGKVKLLTVDGDMPPGSDIH